METIYIHDCDSCEFLGTILSENLGMVDAYFCPIHSEVIARFSDRDEDYLAIATEALPVMAGLKHNDPGTVYVGSGNADIWRKVAVLMMERE